MLQIQAGKVEDGDRLRRSCGKADVGAEIEETTRDEMRGRKRAGRKERKREQIGSLLSMLKSQ